MGFLLFFMIALLVFNFIIINEIALILILRGAALFFIWGCLWAIVLIINPSSVTICFLFVVFAFVRMLFKSSEGFSFSLPIFILIQVVMIKVIKLLLIVVFFLVLASQSSARGTVSISIWGRRVLYNRLSRLLLILLVLRLLSGDTLESIILRGLMVTSIGILTAFVWCHTILSGMWGCEVIVKVVHSGSKSASPETRGIPWDLNIIWVLMIWVCSLVLIKVSLFAVLVQVKVHVLTFRSCFTLSLVKVCLWWWWCLLLLLKKSARIWETTLSWIFSTVVHIYAPRSHLIVSPIDWLSISTNIGLTKVGVSKSSIEVIARCFTCCILISL